MTYTLDALRADIAAVVAYNLPDEEGDYEEQVESGEDGEGHIVHLLRRLDAFVGD